MTIDSVKTDSAKRILPYCESLGDNCELGFVMMHLRYSKGGLFRWSYSPFESVVRYISSPFREIYKFDDLVPVSAAMVSDRSINISFHTDMKSSNEGSSFAFIDDVNKRKEIHRVEKGKMDYLASGFNARLKAGNCVFVVKRNKGISHQEVDSLVSALRLHEGFDSSIVLVVRETDRPELVGTVERVSEHILNGWLTRFAPYSNANQVVYDEWISVLSATEALFVKYDSQTGADR